MQIHTSDRSIVHTYQKQRNSLKLNFLDPVNMHVRINVAFFFLSKSSGIACLLFTLYTLKNRCMGVLLFFFRNDFLFDLTLLKIVVCRKQKTTIAVVIKIFFFVLEEKYMIAIFTDASNYDCLLTKEKENG